MGCFGYLCKGCNTAIRGDCFSGGEKTIMIHVRHGVELGRVEGHYDEYGRVFEQKTLPEEQKFRGNCEGINGHSELCSSEFRQEDSYCKVIEKRIYNSEKLSTSFGTNIVSFYTYVGRRILEESKEYRGRWQECFLFELLSKETKDELLEKLSTATTKEEKNDIDIDIYVALDDLKYDDRTILYEEFLKLPPVILEKYSGIVAWHSLCYKRASEQQKSDLTPSLQDPNQSWGKIRKKYI